MKKYSIYIRVSTAKQGDSGLGLEAQESSCRRYIESVNGEVSSIFKDIESGKSRTRDGLWGAIEHCKESKETLVIAKLDRLARDVEFTFRVINTGIDIYFVDMPIVNTMILGVFASIAQYERELTSKRTKDALHARKSRGEETGGTNNLWGKNTGSDREEVLDGVREKSAIIRRKRAMENSSNKFFWTYVKQREKLVGGGEIDFIQLSAELNSLGQKTATGLPYNTVRAQSMYNKLKKMHKDVSD